MITFLLVHARHNCLPLLRFAQSQFSKMCIISQGSVGTRLKCGGIFIVRRV